MEELGADAPAETLRFDEGGRLLTLVQPEAHG
jgi:hypothetical protein